MCRDYGAVALDFAGEAVAQSVLGNMPTLETLLLVALPRYTVDYIYIYCCRVAGLKRHVQAALRNLCLPVDNSLQVRAVAEH